MWLLFGPAFAAGVVALYALVVGLWIAGLGRSALRAEGARPLSGETTPRVLNLVRGLSADLDIPAPSLWVLADAAPNAFVCRIRGGGALALSPSVYTDFARTELEAVVAHCLSRLAVPGEVRRASLAAGLGGLAGPLTPHRDLSEDVRTVALTRYPPALASAIERSTPHGGRWAALWFVPAGSRFPSPEDRAAALRDL